MESKIVQQAVQTCAACGGVCIYVGHEEPSRFAAIRALGVIQERWQCRTCNAEYVRNVQPVEETA
jgi:hypothetical protein